MGFSETRTIARYGKPVVTATVSVRLIITFQNEQMTSGALDTFGTVGTFGAFAFTHMQSNAFVEPDIAFRAPRAVHWRNVFPHITRSKTQFLAFEPIKHVPVAL
jgi:hypothetical protein